MYHEAMLGRNLRGVHLAQRGQARAIGQDAIDLEIGVPLDLGLRLEEGQDLLHEALLGGVVAVGLHLRDPEREAAGALAREFDVVLEVRDALVVGLAVPVDGDEVDRAGRALGQELVEPVQPDVGFGVGLVVVAVADRGRAEFGFAGVRLHVLPPGGDGFVGSEVGLRGEVGFVEGEEVGRAFAESTVGILVPVRGVHRDRAPHHGNVIEVRGNFPSRSRVPVVAPRNRAFFEGRSERSGIVDQPALGARSRRDRAGLGGAFWRAFRFAFGFALWYALWLRGLCSSNRRVGSISRCFFLNWSRHFLRGRGWRLFLYRRRSRCFLLHWGWCLRFDRCKGYRVGLVKRQMMIPVVRR